MASRRLSKFKRPHPTVEKSRPIKIAGSNKSSFYPTSGMLKSTAYKLLKGFDTPSAESYSLARKTITEAIDRTTNDGASPRDTLLFLLSLALSGRALPGYATLDFEHIMELQLVLDAISRYQEDGSQKRPLNFLMLASPGAGKSHLIGCIASKLGAQKIGAVNYNMVGLQRHEDLIPALDLARNYKVEDRLPLLFLDEFDAQERQFGLLLPLLWDGQLTLGQHDLKLGKVVIVLAGSDPRLPTTMEHARSMKMNEGENDSHPPKLVDLLSRINGGVLRIPQFSDRSQAPERRADKICVAVQLLRHRFGSNLRTVPIALLRFIASTEFRYGVRSIAHLIDLIPHVRGLIDLRLSTLKLPLDDPEKLKSSSLAYHLLSDDHAHGVVKTWKEQTRIRGQILVYTQTLDLLSRFEYDQLRIDWAVERLWLDVQERSSRSLP